MTFLSFFSFLFFMFFMFVLSLPPLIVVKVQNETSRSPQLTIQSHGLIFRNAIFSTHIMISSSVAHQPCPPDLKRRYVFFVPQLAEPMFDRAADQAQISAFVEI